MITREDVLQLMEHYAHAVADCIDEGVEPLELKEFLRGVVSVYSKDTAQYMLYLYSSALKLP